MNEASIIAGIPEKDEIDSVGCVNERRIILLGKTGAGKSATGNTILGSEKFISAMSPQSVTTKCQSAEAMINGKLVVIIDTPGFFDTIMSKDNLIKEIAKSLGISAPGPHVFLYVINASVRQTEEEVKSIDTALQIFDEEIYNNLIVVFTFCDEIEAKLKKSKKTLDEYFKEMRSEIKTFVEKCNNRKLFFRNIDTAGKEQVTELFAMIENMKKENRKPYFSNKMLQKFDERIIQEMTLLNVLGNYTSVQMRNLLRRKISNGEGILLALVTIGIGCGLMALVAAATAFTAGAVGTALSAVLCPVT